MFRIYDENELGGCIFFFKKLAFEKKLHIIIAVKIFGNPIFEEKNLFLLLIQHQISSKSTENGII